MQNLNYRTLLLKYRNNTVSGNDLSNLWECFSNQRNAFSIQSMFLDDLNSFAVSATKDHVDFKTIFKNIQDKIEDKDDVTFIYNRNDMRHFQFSDTLEAETFTQPMNGKISTN